MEENESNTEPKQRRGGKPFTKGDARINRNGRPKTFDAWRKMTVEILREPAIDAKTKGPVIITDADGNQHIATNAEMIARSWIQSPKRQRDVIEAAFGKVPDELNVTSNSVIKVTVKHDDETDGS